MIEAKAAAPTGQLLTDDEVRNTLDAVEGQFANQRVLVLIPDHTRSVPLLFLFRALGMHPPLSKENLNKLVGIAAKERATTSWHLWARYD